MAHISGVLSWGIGKAYIGFAGYCFVDGMMTTDIWRRLSLSDLGLRKALSLQLPRGAWLEEWQTSTLNPKP